MIIGYNEYGHVPNDYEVVGTGDFNGDGKSGDVVWRHVTGQVDHVCPLAGGHGRELPSGGSAYRVREA